MPSFVTKLTEDQKVDIARYLMKQHWAIDKSEEQLIKSLNHSDNFALIEDEVIAYVRVINDRSTFAYIRDVFVKEKYRANGHAQFLFEKIFSDDRFKTIDNWNLRTKYAHKLYEKFDFEVVSDEYAKRLMVRLKRIKN
nr:hypothetical protein UJ101_00784 [Flavobacteriaceae bacterium UJ101]